MAPSDRYAAERSPPARPPGVAGRLRGDGQPRDMLRHDLRLEDDWKTLGIQVVSNAVTTVTSGGDSMATRRRARLVGDR